jgi:hypothetical protein
VSAPNEEVAVPVNSAKPKQADRHEPDGYRRPGAKKQPASVPTHD